MPRVTSYLISQEDSLGHYIVFSHVTLTIYAMLRMNIEGIIFMMMVTAVIFLLKYGEEFCVKLHNETF